MKTAKTTTLCERSSETKTVEQRSTISRFVTETPHPPPKQKKIKKKKLKKLGGLNKILLHLILLVHHFKKNVVLSLNIESSFEKIRLTQKCS